MRIISDFHDYYDCISRYDEDYTIIYLRKKRKLKNIKLWELPNGYPNCIPSSNLFFIGFCGKLYGGLYFNRKLKTLDNQYINKIYYCYLLEDVDKAVENEDRIYQRKYWENKNKWVGSGYFNTRNLCAKQFEYIHNLNEKTDLFLKEKTPAFVWYPRSEVVVINPCLKKYNFYRILPPDVAYQELVMYFGSVLAKPERSIPAVDDKTMAEIKGFNKYSFRKDKK